MHRVYNTRYFLEETFPNRWIGEASIPTAWPPHTPDIKLMVFFFRGYVRGIVLDKNLLETRIQGAILTISEEISANTCT